MVSLAGFEPAPNRVSLTLAGWAIRSQSGGVYQFRDRDKETVEVTGLEPVGLAWLGLSRQTCYPHVSNCGSAELFATSRPIRFSFLDFLRSFFRGQDLCQAGEESRDAVGRPATHFLHRNADGNVKLHRAFSGQEACRYISS